ncbi:MAG: ankyrin repeat domain-containing protein [Pseudomonadota bacterium]
MASIFRKLRNQFSKSQPGQPTTNSNKSVRQSPSNSPRGSLPAGSAEAPPSNSGPIERRRSSVEGPGDPRVNPQNATSSQVEDQSQPEDDLDRLRELAAMHQMQEEDPIPPPPDTPPPDLAALGNVYRPHLPAIGSAQPTQALTQVELSPVNVSERDEYGWTDLHLAAMWGSEEDVAKLMAESPWKADERGPDGSTAMFCAARRNNIGAIKTLMQRIPTHLETPDNKGDTPLIAATYMERSETVETLLTLGADAYVRGSSGGTALHIAATRCDMQLIIDALLNWEPGLVDFRSTGGETALCLAAKQGNGEAVRALLAAGADPDLAEVDLSRFMRSERYANGWTDLHIAALQGDEVRVAELMAESPWKAAECAPDGSTAMLYAAQLNKAGVIAELMRHLPNHIETRSDSGNTPLLGAVSARQYEAVDTLLRLGADAHAKCSLGYNALHTAAVQGDRRLIDALATGWPSLVDSVADDGNTALGLAVATGHTEAVEALLLAGANVNQAGDDGVTPLMKVVLTGNLPLVKILLSDPRIDLYASRKVDGASALFFAAAHGHTEIVRLLLDRPDKRDQLKLAWSKDRWGATALSIAADNGQREAVGMLRRAMGPPPGGQLKKVRRPGTPTCFILTGDKLEPNRQRLLQTRDSGDRDLALRFLGIGDGMRWEYLSNPDDLDTFAGTHWLIRAHGQEWTPSSPRHELGLTSEESVGTNEVVRVLAENGVRNMDIWSCHIGTAAKHLAFRLENDMSWPVTEGLLTVTFHSSDEDATLVALNSAGMENMLHDLVSPGTPSRFRALDVSGSIKVIFDPATRRARTLATAAPNLAELRERLPKLIDEDKRQLVGHYLHRCGESGLSEEIARVFALEEFRGLANVNFPLNGITLLARAVNKTDVDLVKVLMAQSNVDLAEPHLVAFAANSGDSCILNLLLARPETWSQRTDAIEWARHQGRLDNAALLEAHLLQNP